MDACEQYYVNNSKSQPEHESQDSIKVVCVRCARYREPIPLTNHTISQEISWDEPYLVWTKVWRSVRWSASCFCLVWHTNTPVDANNSSCITPKLVPPQSTKTPLWRSGHATFQYSTRTTATQYNNSALLCRPVTLFPQVLT
jgi:hypothetical protein